MAWLKAKMEELDSRLPSFAKSYGWARRGNDRTRIGD